MPARQRRQQAERERLRRVSGALIFRQGKFGSAQGNVNVRSRLMLDTRVPPDA
jgi:hypothetical protein